MCLLPVSLYLHPLSLSSSTLSFSLSLSLCISKFFFVFFPFVARWQMPNWMMNVPLLCSNWTAGSSIGRRSCGWARLIGWTDRVEGSGVGCWLAECEWRLAGVAALLSICLLTHTHAHTHTHTQTLLLAMSSPPPPPIIPAFLLTSHTREWCGCYRVHMLVWILINYVDGPNINYKHFYDCWHFALAVVSLYFCPAWCYSTQLSHFKHLPPLPLCPSNLKNAFKHR